MIIVGYRHGAKSIDAINAVRKHTGKSLAESKKLIEQVMNGTPVELPNDFVLREDLEDANFLVS